VSRSRRVALCALGLVAAGCAGSLRELRQVASREHGCPEERIKAFYCEKDMALLDVCGTYRKYQYASLHPAGRVFAPQSWQEVDIATNYFDPRWVDSMLLYDAWAASASDAWVVGTEGAVFRFDGKRWIAWSCEGDVPHLYGVWGADAGAVWVVGSRGTAYRWNGDELRKEVLPTDKDLVGVHGTSRSDVWIVGREGVILHWDGSGWKPVASGVTRDLYRVFAVRRDLAWAVGDGGTLLTWDGRTWRKGDLGTRAPLVTVWGSSARDVWVGARTGQVYRWDGRRWEPVRIHSVEEMRESAPGLNRIFGFAADDVWALGMFVHHFDGQTWKRLDRDPTLKRAVAGGGPASWGSSSRDVHGVFYWGERARRKRESSLERAEQNHWDGKRWTRQRWPVWPCGRPRGKVGPRPFRLRPRGPGY